VNDKVILLVEDNEDDVELILRVFKQHKCANEIVIMRDGADALDWLFGAGKHAGRNAMKLPTVILLDLKLPKVNGFQILNRIRSDERTRLLPVVILTSSKEEADRLKGYEEGANSFVQKPVEFQQFNDAVRHLGLYWLLLNEPPPRKG
jgi:CheY-like chemotaxis protein